VFQCCDFTDCRRALIGQALKESTAPSVSDPISVATSAACRNEKVFRDLSLDAHQIRVEIDKQFHTSKRAIRRDDQLATRCLALSPATVRVSAINTFNVSVTSVDFLWGVMSYLLSSSDEI